MNNSNTENRKVQVKKAKARKIAGYEPVQLTRHGEKFAEVLKMSRTPIQTIKKLSKTKYIVLSTGEIKEFSQKDIKQIQAVKDSMRILRGIIRANFNGGTNERHITLTYQENITDHEKLYSDFQNWFLRLKRNYKNHEFNYIAVAEPQERGAWHMHLLLKTNKPILFLEYSKKTADKRNNILKMWRDVIGGGGSVRVEEIPSDDVGTYFVAYFTDLIPPDIAADGDSQEMSKARQKGARLNLYPVGMKFYRCSRGIIRPKPEDALYSDVRQEYGSPTYQESFEIIETDETQENERLLQTIQRQTHKKKREKD